MKTKVMLDIIFYYIQALNLCVSLSVVSVH